MRSFQEEHELQEIQRKAAAKASSRPASPAATPPPTAATAQGRVSPIRQAAQMRPTSRPTSPAATAAPASEEPPAQPDEVTTFRTNITIGVMILTVVLLGMVAANSGSNPSLTFPRAVVFFVDGASAGDVARAVRLSRAPFIGMLGDAGVSTLSLGAGACLHGTPADRVSDSASLVVEMFTGSAAGGSPSVLKRAKAQGISVALLGAWPMRNEPDGHGCWALSNECEDTCLGHAPTPASKCNFDQAVAVERPEEFVNATREAINTGNHIIAVRVPSVPVDPTNADSRDEALYIADAALGRAAMAAVERTVETNENVLIAVVAASPADSAAHVSFATFQRDQPRVLTPFVRYPQPPRVGDVAAVLAAWLGIDVASPPLAAGVENKVLCGSGAKPVDCDLSRR